MQKFRTGSKNCHRVCKCWGRIKAMQDGLILRRKGKRRKGLALAAQ